MNADFISAIQELGKEKGIEPELLFQAVEEALVTAYKKNTGASQNVRVDMNKVTDKHNVLQEEDRGVGKCMINRILWPVMN